ncbi:uncharacterized protein G2W53_008130 [Senna tora]|uniref:Uncharacterized protein n=1 Tax=Senna tora TaxID=362788 RepID=A0A834X6I4_9FABA|nr:uncharacterized protein G2W53_008130 [Senna tora]
MKIKNKGKVYPSPSSCDGNILSVLKLLPAAILTLASALPLEDREVLAYMITRSIDSSVVILAAKKKPSKKPLPHTHTSAPLFDCDCFDCYTSYWYRWDSSPNRKLIDQVMDAFEDHLTSGENAKKNAARGKKKERTTRPRVNPALDMEISSRVVKSLDNEANLSVSPEQPDNASADAQPEAEKTEVANAAAAAAVAVEEVVLVVPTSAASTNRGLARKVLPDVMGLLNSRLWNLWSPNV